LTGNGNETSDGVQFGLQLDSRFEYSHLPGIRAGRLAYALDALSFYLINDFIPLF